MMANVTHEIDLISGIYEIQPYRTGAGILQKNLESLGCEVDIITNPSNIEKIRYVDISSSQMVLSIDDHDYCDRIDQNEFCICWASRWCR